MPEADRRPTAQEIEELIDLVRRDPGSPSFIDLGEAYLALGRPRDAIQVGNLGLEAAPDNLEGRVMLARAYHALHQWKEAQGELLRVVKVDRSNRAGFALLGEVLLRRTDFERAVPVLQHAQNLDPTSPAILSMLRRARAGQPLDPPPSIPQPIPPRGETANPADIQRSMGPRPTAAGMPGMAPPGMAPPRPGMQMPLGGPGSPPPAPSVPVAAPNFATMAIEPAPAAPVGYDPGGYPSQPVSPEPASRKPPPAVAPPPMSLEGIRPRIVSAHREQNAAARSLRQSAAVGESYLNDLLTGGLLDVAGVRVPDAEFDLRPDRRWGRSTRRAFIFLFVVLVLGIGGGGTWYWWSETQKAEAVARLQKESKTLIGAGDFGGLEASLAKLNEALQQDKSNLITFAYVVEATGLEALLYGTEQDRVDRAIKAIGKDLPAGSPGARELVIGSAAVDLSRLYAQEPAAAAATLASVNEKLDGFLKTHDKDLWARWLKGRAQQAAGQRKAARESFKAAAGGGLAIAMIDEADLLVDDGKLDEALALYKKANDATSEQVKDHPLNVLGRSIGRAEASHELDVALGELNDKFKSDLAPRIAAYRWLALSLSNLAIEDYPKALETLTKATTSAKPPGEPRFWARAAWAHYVLGDLRAAAQASTKITWIAKQAESDPPSELLDAALALASGLPERALELAAKLEGVRPRMLRVHAYLDLAKYKDALGEAEELLKLSPANTEAQILREQAAALAAPNERDRATALDELEKLARKANSKLGRHALGVARLATGDVANAKLALENAISDVSDTLPNPVAYRTLTALAEVALAEKDIAAAGRYLDWALDPEASRRPELTLSNGTKIAALGADKARTPFADALKANSGYFPTLAMQARVVLRNREPDRALELLAPILKESSAVTPAVNLTLAEALVTKKGATAKEKERAKEILVALKSNPQVPATELGRIAALIDPKLPKELDLPEPSEDAAAAPGAAAPAEKPAKKSGRRGR